MIQDWSSVTLGALSDLWYGFAGFIPKLIGALIIFVVGWFIAVWLGKLVAEILKRIKFDRIFEKTKWEEAMSKAELKMSMSGFAGGLVKWILVIVFLLAAVEILGMAQFADFLKNIVAWLPNVIVAAAIFVVAVIVADILEKLVKAVVGKMDVKYVNWIGSVVRWSIWVFAILAALSQLGIGSDIIQILVTGFVALIVISGGLAIGLGGKDTAKEMIEELRNKLRN
ncbi:MAG: hypothetical protein PHU56_01105 [Candidatus Pacebacteria bacterium]|nr:hypothetical protein [Candidatus Paceibacterota bacterium]